LLVVDLAGRDEDQVAAADVGLAPGGEIVDIDGAYALLAAKHGAAERLIGESGGPQFVEDDVGRRILGLGEFLQNDFLLADQIGRVEMRAQQHVRQKLDAKREMLGQQGGAEAGAFAVGGGVEVAADILDRLADRARAAAAGALEHHMLEQVGDAVERGRLVA
jgi:hypothetical protein